MKNKILLSVVALLFSVIAFAQKPVIAFDQTSHDFGVVAEEAGSITHVFEFTNTGDADLLITNVSASCGCTTPKWTREPITPGGKGAITVTYSTSGRPGMFNKTITVSNNTESGKVILAIKGEVTKKKTE